mmetsp:Transcript_5500/g.9529  ORF Transcript_5500/g.9529 Transcript_5500/m.9529 type:complete len:106 (+) Transcript_5500:278-595(+)
MSDFYTTPCLCTSALNGTPCVMASFRCRLVQVTQAPSLAQSASFFKPTPGQAVLSISTVPTTYSMNFGSYAAGDVLYGGGELMTSLVGWAGPAHRAHRIYISASA